MMETYGEHRTSKNEIYMKYHPHLLTKSNIYYRIVENRSHPAGIHERKR